jgi:RNA polymerase sigma-70 factor (ECF subfamily)
LKNEIVKNLGEPGKLSNREVASGLYDRLAPQVLGLIAQVLSSRKDAEEILQQVFLRLESEPQVLQQEGFSVAVWLMLEAREGALARLHMQTSENNVVKPKAPKLSQTRPRGDSTEAKKGNHARPPARALLAEWLPNAKVIERVDGRLGILHRAVDQLPPEQRRALDLAVFGGLSEAEIATEMGEPLGKVQRSLRAAVTFVKHRCRAVSGTWSANI